MGAPFGPTFSALLVGALTLGSLFPGALLDDDCPDRCTCSRIDQLDMKCALPNTNVSIKGEPGQWIQIFCDEEEEFSIADLPQLQHYGSSIRLELHYCRLPRTLVAAAPRLGAASLHSLYIHSPVEDVNITAEMVAGLDQLERLAVFADKVNVSIPSAAFPSLPALQRLTINSARVSLTAGDFHTAGALRYLELSNCDIPRLPDGLFANLTKLEKLCIWGNKLQELTPSQLEGLVSLQELEVSRNLLVSVRGLAAAPRLRVVSAFANRLTELPDVENNTDLEKIQIFDNRVPLSLPPRGLANLPKLQSIDLSRCGITNIPTDAFTNSTALKTLKLAANKLITLDAGVFKDLSALEELDLSRNNIGELDAKLFRPLQSLKSLKLDFNNVTRLPSNIFSGLSSLRRLSISHNRVTSLPAAALAGASRVEDLDLSHNNITNPDPNTENEKYQLFSAAFTQLSVSLVSLDLSNNALTALPSDIQHAAIGLKKMDLSYNRIQEVEIYDLQFVSNSATVDLTHNHIKTIFVEPADNRSSSPSDLKRSTVLLDDNPFVCDCNLYTFAQRLHGFKTLDTTEARVELENARCSRPPSLSFKLLRSVPLRDYTCDLTESCPPSCNCSLIPYTRAVEITCKELPESYPDMTQFGNIDLELKLIEKPTYLNITTEIRLLNLSGLSLQAIPPGALPNNLKIIDLTNNNLSVIPTSLLEKDLHLKIAKNPILCDCWHAEDVAALQEQWWAIEDYEQANCSTNVPISQVNVLQLCSTWRASVIGGVLAMLGILTAIAALLLLKFSFEIKVWLYARGMFARWFVIDDDDRTYDAFVSFCHKDEDFVTEYLLPGLENVPQPYKLCIHSRDWMPGEFITTQIAQSVADSRRTIIVVSRNFLNSQWARAEFRTANMTAIKEGKTRVIAILLEDVNSHKELDPELKAYLSTNTYLKWGDPWFWDKLRYALPHRKLEGLNTKQRAKAKIRDTLAKARANEARKVVASGLDTRLTPDGVIINAAALAVRDDKKCEQINLDMSNFNKIKSMV